MLRKTLSIAGGLMAATALSTAAYAANTCTIDLTVLAQPRRQPDILGGEQ